MRRLLLACIGFTALAVASVLAADAPQSRSLARPRAPAYVPYFSWTGFYLGVNAGYGFGQSNWTDTLASTATGNFDIKGALLGGTAGYNVQLGAIVVGIEGDVGWSSIKGSTSVAGCGTACETSNDRLATIRGRFGYAFDRFLPYLTGGVSLGKIEGTIAGGGSIKSNNIGWTAGGGLEYAFVDNWSVKAEYLYTDLGKVTCEAICSGAAPFELTFKTNLVRGGLNYRF
jgi:outer membrane immunogenic protein